MRAPGPPGCAGVRRRGPPPLCRTRWRGGGAGQARVEIGQPPPGGEDLDVVDERRPVGPLAGPGPARGHRRELGDEIVVELLECLQVPPAAHLFGGVAEGYVVAAEEVDVLVQAVLEQVVACVVEGVGRGDPDPGRDRAEAQPGQPGPELVPVLALALRHREDGDDPAVVGDGVPFEDAPVTGLQDGTGVRRARSPRGRPRRSDTRISRRLSREMDERTAWASTSSSASSRIRVLTPIQPPTSRA